MSVPLSIRDLKDRDDGPGPDLGLRSQDEKIAAGFVNIRQPKGRGRPPGSKNKAGATGTKSHKDKADKDDDETLFGMYKKLPESMKTKPPDRSGLPPDVDPKVFAKLDARRRQLILECNMKTQDPRIQRCLKTLVLLPDDASLSQAESRKRQIQEEISCGSGQKTFYALFKTGLSQFNRLVEKISVEQAHMDEMAGFSEDMMPAFGGASLEDAGCLEPAVAELSYEYAPYFAAGNPWIRLGMAYMGAVNAYRETKKKARAQVLKTQMQQTNVQDLRDKFGDL